MRYFDYDINGVAMRSDSDATFRKQNDIVKSLILE